MIIQAIKKPMIVEVVQFTGTEDNIYFMMEWSNHQVWPSEDGKILKVKCLEALAETPIGSYVVKGIKGEVWPIREDIFNETYEIVSPTSSL